MKKQQGFAVLEALLVVVVVALIGGAGYYVWNSHQSSASKSENSSKQNQQKSSSGLFPDDPSTVAFYANKQLGFQVEYPKSFGAARFSERHGASGKSYIIDFTEANGESAGYTVAINSSDYRSQPADAPFADITNVDFDNTTLTMADGTTSKMQDVIRNKDSVALFTGGKFGPAIVGVKKADSINGVPDATVTVANNGTDSSAATKNIVVSMVSLVSVLDSNNQ